MYWYIPRRQIEWSEDSFPLLTTGYNVMIMPGRCMHAYSNIKLYEGSVHFWGFLDSGYPRMSC
jgi:hypothetical protein